ncbi:unnamed protein product [Cunninghamella blakesleeana]
MKSFLFIGYKDLEITFLLYDLQKDLQLPSCVWKEILVNCQDKQMILLNEGFIHQLLDQPFQVDIIHQWLKAFPSIPTFIQTRLKLHHATHSIEMNAFINTLHAKGYQFKTVSLDLYHLIQDISNLPILLELETQIDLMIVNLLTDINFTDIITYKYDLLNHVSSIKLKYGDTNDEDALLKECTMMLIDTPTKYLPLMTLCMISVISNQLSNDDNKKEKEKEILTFCFPFWCQALSQKVNETLSVDDVNHPIVKDLLIFMNCYLLFFITFPSSTSVVSWRISELSNIWKSYSLYRSTFFFPTIIDDPISSMIEKLISCLFSLHSK